MAYFNEIKTVIFDLDNTLIDRQKAAIKLMKKIILDDFAKDGHSVQFYEDLLEKLNEWDYEGHAPKDDCFTKYIKYTKITGRDWRYYSNLWTDHLQDYTELFAHSIDVLDYLKPKYRLALLTNGSVRSQRAKLDKIGIDAYFEKIVISGTYGIHKPDQRIFQILLDQLGICASEAVYIGDGLRNDVQGALNMGMRSIWVYPHPDIDTDIACQRIYKIEDLKELL